MSSSARNFIPKLYYAITPVFFLLDYFLHINVRVTVLDSEPLYKGLYYGFCIFCGVVVYIIPWCSSIVALVESVIIIVMTILGIFIQYARTISQTDDILNMDFETIGLIGPEQVVNLAIVAVIASCTFSKSLSELKDIRERYL
jgi:hypothetical protein